MHINDRIRKMTARLRASKDESKTVVASQVLSRVATALSIPENDEKLTAAVQQVDFLQLAASYPEQAHQITAAVRQVTNAVVDALDVDVDVDVRRDDMLFDAPTEDDLELAAFTGAIDNVLAGLLVGEYSRDESVVVAAIQASAEDIQAAYESNEDLSDRLAEAVPVILNALDIEFEDDLEDAMEDALEDELNDLCGNVSKFISAHFDNPKLLANLAANLNAMSNLSLAAVQEKL